MKNFLQRLGKSFMLPVAILPVMSILFGIGYALDYTGSGKNNLIAAILLKAGLAIIDNIPLLFAVGIPIGLAKQRDGAAALSGLVGFLVIQNLLKTDSVALYQHIEEAQVNAAFGKINNVFIGIIAGLIAAAIFNRFSKTELPSALAFFSGRRLVPILTVFATIAVSILLYFIWPVLYTGLVSLGTAIQKLGAVGAGLYGFLNRLLIPTGLHHALNAVFWFDTIGINDLNNFWANTGVLGETGRYMAGFFPIMMFGMPGAALAMYHTAKSDRKKMVGSMLLAGSISAFVTGLTEPVEFLFMFLSPLLYLIHAILTGISLFISASFKWTAGFNFSAGLIDWLASTRVPLVNQPLMLLVQGVIFFFLYYFIFRFFIQKFDLKTPGREDEATSYLDVVEEAAPVNTVAVTPYDKVAQKIYDGLGGRDNIVNFDFCATRVRAEVKDGSKVSPDMIKSAGVTNVIARDKSVQVIIGPKVQFVVDAMDRIHANQGK